MKRLMLLIVLGAMSHTAAATNNPATIDALRWLGGQWVEQQGAASTREHWAGPYGSTMLGFGVTVRADGSTSYAFYRIACTPAGLVYIASPDSKSATEFRAVELSDSRVVFENKSHDYPQRIIYQRRGRSSLDARIEGTFNGRSMGRDWHYSRDDAAALFGPAI